MKNKWIYISRCSCHRSRDKKGKKSPKSHRIALLLTWNCDGKDSLNGGPPKDQWWDPSWPRNTKSRYPNGYDSTVPHRNSTGGSGTAKPFFAAGFVHSTDLTQIGWRQKNKSSNYKRNKNPGEKNGILVKYSQIFHLYPSSAGKGNHLS